MTVVTSWEPKFSIKSQPLGVLIADGLRREILEGQLSAGQELRQEELAERFGTSRIPVREAMQALERDGLVVVLPNRRTVVARFEEPDIRDHYRARALIEGESAYSCAEKGVDVSAVEQVQAELETVAPHEAQSRYELLNHRFHSWIWAQSGSRWLERLAQTLWQGISPHTPAFVPGQPDQAALEHRAILSAIRSGDPELAKAAMRIHILRSCDSLLAHRRSTQSPSADGRKQSCDGRP